MAVHVFHQFHGRLHHFTCACFDLHCWIRRPTPNPPEKLTNHRLFPMITLTFRASRVSIGFRSFLNASANHKMVPSYWTSHFSRGLGFFWGFFLFFFGIFFCFPFWLAFPCVFHWFSFIFLTCPLFSIDFPCFSLAFHWFYFNFLIFPLFSIGFPWFSLVFLGFPCFSIVLLAFPHFSIVLLRFVTFSLV